MTVLFELTWVGNIPFPIRGPLANNRSKFTDVL